MGHPMSAVRVDEKVMDKLSYVVVGIQHTGDVLSQVSVQNSLNVATNIDCKGKQTYIKPFHSSSFNSCSMI